MAGEDRAASQPTVWECAAQPSIGERRFLLPCVIDPAWVVRP